MNANLNAIETQVNQNVRFELLSIDKFKKRPPVRWVVKNLLPAQGLAIMYGQSGTGKTFLMLDLLLAIASGDNWFGHPTTKTPVCYVCLEGIGGIHQRIAAWEIATGRPIPDNFRVITDSFSLGIQQDVIDLAISIYDSGFSGGVIAIDTLNAATPRMDENSSKDMGKTIEHLKLLQLQINGLVMTSHHTGKDETRGMRGHSSLHGAIDAEIYLQGTGPTRSWTLKKMRDFENGETHGFKLVVHELDTDEDGEIITSCSIGSDALPFSGTRKPSGCNQLLVFNQICRLIEEESKIAGHPVGVAYEIVIENAAIALSNLDSHKRKYNAEKIVPKLIAQHFFECRIDNGKEFIALI